MFTCFERWLGSNRTPLLVHCQRALAWRGALLLLGLQLGLTGRVQAQPEPAHAAAQPAAAGAFRVAVLRGSEGDVGELATAVDAAMLRDLALIAGIENPTVSPIDFAEIGLTVGCSDQSRACLVAIAQMLEVDAVVVRRLWVDAKRARLSLAYVDPRSEGEPIVAQREAPRADALAGLPPAMPALVRSLFGIPEPVAPAPAQQAPAGASSAPTSATADVPDAQVRVLTWIALAAGAGTLAAGLAMGANASSEFDHYQALPVRTAADAERASERFATVQSRAHVANVLMPTGAALLALGGVLLVLDLTREPARRALSLAPLPGGALLSIRASGGGL